MKRLNCIVVLNEDKTKLLFCKRKKDPFRGLYNFVGGKVEKGESGMTAAYRELYEETGIPSEEIPLFHFMDLTYYHQDFILVCPNTTGGRAESSAMAFIRRGFF